MMLGKQGLCRCSKHAVSPAFSVPPEAVSLSTSPAMSNLLLIVWKVYREICYRAVFIRRKTSFDFIMLILVIKKVGR